MYIVMGPGVLFGSDGLTTALAVAALQGIEQSMKGQP